MPRRPIRKLSLDSNESNDYFESRSTNSRGNGARALRAGGVTDGGIGGLPVRFLKNKAIYVISYIKSEMCLLWMQVGVHWPHSHVY